MNTAPETPDLLRAYVDHGSEAAFQELVSRYINLVYSVALRRVNGDTHFAEDVVQAVFTDLARKAATLPGNVLLGGWLHRHTRFVASNLLRVEQRRTAREQEAAAMNLLSSDADWQNVAPVLDEAIELLEASDRDAIVLRYLEQRDLRSVGLALGITEDTAQKRVSRAVEKLRALLLARGATLTVAVLATALTTQTVIAAPASLAARVGKTALASAGSAGLIALLLRRLAPAKIAVASVVIVAAVVLGWPRQPEIPRAVAAAPRTAPQTNQPAPRPVAVTAPVAALVSPTTNAIPAVAEPADTNILRVLFLNAENNRPIRNVPIDVNTLKDNKITGQKLRANRDGLCDVPVPPEKFSSLELITRLDGFADTRVAWRPDRGFAVPRTLVLRLTRPTPLGGRVVDADGQPVADAQVFFAINTTLYIQAREETGESHAFFGVPLKTDAEGKWHLSRIAEEMVRFSVLSVSHPDFIHSNFIRLESAPGAEAALRAGNHVMTLDRGITVTGEVVDATGRPVANATVTANKNHTPNRKSAKSSPDGKFTIPACEPGSTVLNGEAPGYALVTSQIELSTNSPPLRLVLSPAKSLRLRIVDPAANPVEKARVFLDLTQNSSVQKQFSVFTDRDGHVTWTGAPDLTLNYTIDAPGYARRSRVSLRPTDEEQVITLQRALVISGTVRDAATGAPVPKFRISIGSPFQGSDFTAFNEGQTGFDFANGQFRHTFENATTGSTNPTYALKFEAPGFASRNSRTISTSEGEAHLDIRLTPVKVALVTVLLPDGSPAAHAEVGLASSGANLRLKPGGFSRQDPRSSHALLTTDDQGRFALPNDAAIKRIVVAHPAGFADGTLASLAAAPVLRLQPWGNVEGVILAGDQPAPGRRIKFEYGHAEIQAVSVAIGALEAVTDAQGRFKIEQVFPGQHKLMYVVPSSSLLMHLTGIGISNISYSFRPAANVEILPGQTTRVTLGSSDCAVTFRARLPEGVSGNAMATLSSSEPEHIRGQDFKTIAKWNATPEAKAWRSTRQNYDFAEKTPGSFDTFGVPPGSYELNVNVPDPVTRRTAATLRKTVTIPANPAAGTVDLGEFTLHRLVPK